MSKSQQKLIEELANAKEYKQSAALYTQSLSDVHRIIRSGALELGGEIAYNNCVEDIGTLIRYHGYPEPDAYLEVYVWILRQLKEQGKLDAWIAKEFRDVS